MRGHEHEEPEVLVGGGVPDPVGHAPRAEDEVPLPNPDLILPERDHPLAGEYVVALVLGVVRVDLRRDAGPEDVNVREAARRLEEIHLPGLVHRAPPDLLGIEEMLHPRRVLRRERPGATLPA